MHNLIQHKQQLRLELKQRRLQISPSDQVMASLRAADFFQRFWQQQSGLGEQAVAGYWPLSGEFDVRPILIFLQQQGVPCLLPRIEKEQLVFCRWRSQDTLEQGDFGTSQPTADALQAWPTMVLLPLLGFDRQGRRLGYGGGFYDRTLGNTQSESRKKPALIGLGFSCQECAMVPTDEHDVVMDYILTEQGLMKCPF